MRPDLMPDAATYTRFQLSALELGLLLGALGLVALHLAIQRLAAYARRRDETARIDDRLAGRAAGYAGVFSLFHRYNSRYWHHGYAEGQAAKEAGKPLDYLSEVPPIYEKETDGD